MSDHSDTPPPGTSTTGTSQPDASAPVPPKPVMPSSSAGASTGASTGASPGASTGATAKRPGTDRPGVARATAASGSSASGSPGGTGTIRRGSPVAGIALVLVVLEGAALGVLWAHPRPSPEVAGQIAQLQTEADNARDAAAGARSDVDALTTRVASLAKRMDASAQGNASAGPGSTDTGATNSGSQASSSASDAGQSAAIATLRQDLDQSREESRSGIASLASTERADIASIRSAVTDAAGALGAKVTALSTQVDNQAVSERRASNLAATAERLAHLQGAAVALADGRPVGDIPNAPPALARFADASPPTEASLVLSFPAASRAALKASQPDTHGHGFFSRLWTHAQGIVTVREGNRVIVGDPAAGILSAARERLSAGDLAGTVATLGTLNGAAADAIDPWRSKAASLVDARAAVAQMMAHS